MAIPNIDLRRVNDSSYISYLKSQGYSDADIQQGTARAQQTATGTQNVLNTGIANRATGAPVDAATDTIDASQSTLSPNFADYVYRMLARGEQAAGLPFQEYTGERFAGPSELQQQAFRQAAGLTTPSQFEEATGIARLAAQRAGQTSYTPGQFGIERAYAPGLQQFQMRQPSDVSAERISAPSLRDLQMRAAPSVGAERVGTRDIQAAQTGYRPGLQTFQMQAPSERVTAESFTAPGTAAACHGGGLSFDAAPLALAGGALSGGFGCGWSRHPVSADLGIPVVALPGPFLSGRNPLCWPLCSNKGQAWPRPSTTAI